MHQSEGGLPIDGGFRYQPTGEGTGFLFGPDGSRAGIQWEFSPDGAYIARLEKPGADHWGAYRLGFDRLVRSESDLVAALQPLMDRLRTLYQRARVQ